MAADTEQTQESTCLTRETPSMRTVSFFMFSILLFAATVAGSEKQELFRQVRFFHSNDVHGETEPCG